MSKDAEYFIANPEEFAELSDDQQNTFYERGIFEDPQDVEEGASSGAEVDNESNEVPESSSSDDDEPVILGKGGKHTIPYSVLEETRTQAQQWKQQAEAQAEMIKQLQAAQIQDKGTGTTDAQDAVIDEYISEFPEVAEDLKPIIQKMIAEGVKAATEQIEQRVQPIEQRLRDQYIEQHFKSIEAAHPGYQELLDTKEFEQFKTENPFILDRTTKEPLHLETVMAQGTATQAIEMLAQFKASIGSEVKEPPKQPDKANLAGKAKAIIDGVKPKVPGTFSDIPAGTPGTHNEVERILQMSEPERERLFLTMTEEQRNQLFERLA